jgi:polyhydroxybutyrate depolymerase
VSTRLAAGLLLGCVALLVPAGASAAELSSGCGASPPESPPERFEVAGTQRAAIVVLPPGHDHVRPYPLVFGFHGRTNDNARARRYFGLEEAADEPAIFVYPAGLRDESGRFTWADPGDRAGELRDFALFDAILKALASSYCIDLDAVFVVGHSLGASFANSLACARGESIRAVATVAGGIVTSACSGEVAAFLLHNPRDQAVPISEGERARDVLLGDARAGAALASRRIEGFECTEYRRRDQPLLWCLHRQDRGVRGRLYPHRWPEGAAEAIMGFFEMLAE